MEANKRNNLIKYILLLLLLLLLGGCLLYINNLKNSLANSKTTIEAISTNIKKHRDKTGAEISEKELILSSYRALKALHVSDSSEIGRLQGIVNKNTMSATILKNSTSGHKSGTTEIVFIRDTIKGTALPCDTIYPTYKTKISDKWTNMKIAASKDSIQVDYKFFNEYEITQEFKKEGKWPFRHKVPEVRVRNLNPYTQTDQISSYAVQVPKQGKKLITVAGISLGIGILTGFILAK